MAKQAWERVNRPDILEYRGKVKGMDCQLWWYDQPGVKPGWCVRINAGKRGEQDIPVKGRRDSKLGTLHRNVLAALK